MKAHVVSTDEPIRNWQNIVTLCGAEIRDAVALMTIDCMGESSAIVGADAWVGCRKCRKLRPPACRFHYEVVSGEEYEQLKRAEL